MAEHQQVARPDTAPDPMLRRAVTASFIGNFVEWFDYASYGYLATVIAVVFFPDSDPATALLSTFAVFALSFLLRPVGGIVWGSLGDRLGRRWALSWSILLMSASSFCIGLLPSYAMIGLWAPLGLLLLRMVQGFSASGEYAGAATFLSEYAPEGKRGLYTSFVPASTATGLLAGSLMVAVMYQVLSTSALQSWGWRIPFLLAGPLGLVGRYIRVHLEDSPRYREMSEKATGAAAHGTPIGQVLRRHGRSVAIAFGVASLNAVGFYMVLSYLPTYLTAELDIDPTSAFFASTVALSVYIGSIFVMGHISDRVGRKRMLVIASVLFALLSVPLFLLLGVGALWLIVLVEVVFGILLTVNDGTLATFLSELFPTSVRYTGFALSFNLANALLGGTAPFVATWLISATGSAVAPAWYLSLVAVIALGAMLLAKETAFAELKDA